MDNCLFFLVFSLHVKQSIIDLEKNFDQLESVMQDCKVDRC